MLKAPPAVRDYGLLASAAARPGTVVFGHEAYPDLWEKAASLFHSVNANHALIDGNKRLAWSATAVFLGLNGVPVPRIDVDEAEAFVMAVSTGQLAEVPEIARRLRAVYRR
ncbi:MAG TPA: death-on-curing protein [Micromonosporaceae bacterium]|nr:death-on-curing protein [Micromonosporaceae bacterium]